MGRRPTRSLHAVRTSQRRTGTVEHDHEAITEVLDLYALGPGDSLAQ